MQRLEFSDDRFEILKEILFRSFRNSLVREPLDVASYRLQVPLHVPPRVGGHALTACGWCFDARAGDSFSFAVLAPGWVPDLSVGTQWRPSLIPQIFIAPRHRGWTGASAATQVGAGGIPGDRRRNHAGRPSRLYPSLPGLADLPRRLFQRQLFGPAGTRSRCCHWCVGGCRGDCNGFVQIWMR